MNDDDIIRQQAMMLFDRAYRHQINGELGDAILLYKRSLTTYPTAEAYTFLGWTYSLLGRYELAIEMCHRAIEIDAGWGNPYNDIGSYLIELERWEEAVPWLEKAIKAARYEPRHFPHINLGRVYEHFGEYKLALQAYEDALMLEPFSLPAVNMRRVLLGRLN